MDSLKKAFFGLFLIWASFSAVAEYQFFRTDIDTPRYVAPFPYKDGQFFFYADSKFFLYDGTHQIPLDQINQHIQQVIHHAFFDPFSNSIFLINEDKTLDRYDLTSNHFHKNIFLSDQTFRIFKSGSNSTATYATTASAIHVYQNDQWKTLINAPQNHYIQGFAVNDELVVYSTLDSVYSFDLQTSQTTKIADHFADALLLTSNNTLITQSKSDIKIYRDEQLIKTIPVKYGSRIAKIALIANGFVWIDGRDIKHYDFSTHVTTRVARDKEPAKYLVTLNNAFLKVSEQQVSLIQPSNFLARYQFQHPSPKNSSATVDTKIYHHAVASDGTIFISDNKWHVHAFTPESQYLYSINQAIFPEFDVRYIHALSIQDGVLRISGNRVFLFELATRTLTQVDMPDYDHMITTQNVDYLFTEKGLFPFDAFLQDSNIPSMSPYTTVMDAIDKTGVRHRLHVNHNNEIVYRQNELELALPEIKDIDPTQPMTVFFLSQKIWFLQSGRLHTLSADLSKFISLPSSTPIKQILANSDGYIYAQTEHSLFKINPYTSFVSPITEQKFAQFKTPRNIINTEKYLHGLHSRHPVLWPNPLNEKDTLPQMHISAYRVISENGAQTRLYDNGFKLYEGEGLSGIYLSQPIDYQVDMSYQLTVNGATYHSNNGYFELPNLVTDTLQLQGKALWRTTQPLQAEVLNMPWHRMPHVQSLLLYSLGMILIVVLLVAVMRLRYIARCRKQTIDAIKHLANRQEEIMCVLHDGNLQFTTKAFEQTFETKDTMPFASDAEAKAFWAAFKHTDTHFSFIASLCDHRYYIDAEVLTHQDQRIITLSFSPMDAPQTNTIHNQGLVKQTITRLQHYDSQHALIMCRLPEKTVIERVKIINQLNNAFMRYHLSLPFTMMYYSDFGVIIEHTNKSVLFAFLTELRATLERYETTTYLAITNDVGLRAPEDILKVLDKSLIAQHSLYFDKLSLNDEYQMYIQDIESIDLDNIMHFTPVYRRDNQALMGVKISVDHHLMHNMLPQHIEEQVIDAVILHIDRFAHSAPFCEVLYLFLPFALTRLPEPVIQQCMDAIAKISCREIVYHLPEHYPLNDFDKSVATRHAFKLGLRASVAADMSMISDPFFNHIEIDEDDAQSVANVMYHVAQTRLQLIVHNIKNPHYQDYSNYACFALEGPGLTEKITSYDFPETCKPFLRVKRRVNTR